MWLRWQSVWSPASSRQKVVAGGMWAALSTWNTFANRIVRPLLICTSSHLLVHHGRRIQKCVNDRTDWEGVSGHHNPRSLGWISKTMAASEESVAINGAVETDLCEIDWIAMLWHEGTFAQKTFLRTEYAIALLSTERHEMGDCLSLRTLYLRLG